MMEKKEVWRDAANELTVRDVSGEEAVPEPVILPFSQVISTHTSPVTLSITSPTDLYVFHAPGLLRLGTGTRPVWWRRVAIRALMGWWWEVKK